MKYIISIFLLLGSINSFGAQESCTIELANKVIVSDSSGALTNLLSKSSCTPKAMNLMRKHLEGYTGNLDAAYINRVIGKPNNITFNIAPNVVRIYSLPDLIQEKLGNGPKQIVMKSRFIGGDQSLLLNEGDAIHVKCTNCSQPGIKQIKLTTQSILEGTMKPHWIEATIGNRTEVLVAKKPMRYGEELSSSQFIIKTEVVTDPNSFHVSINKLPFYKLTRNLNEGEALLSSHLTPRRLVRPGTAAQVIYEANGIILKNIAMPTQAGRYGEHISLRSLKNNKSIYGKVVAPNKVRVEL